MFLTNHKGTKDMHVISRKKLIEFWKEYPKTKNALETFYTIMDKTNFSHFNHLKQAFPNVDQVGKCTIFDVGGNKVRVIAAIHYDSHKIYIRHVLTHADYDKDKWKTECSQRLH